MPIQRKKLYRLPWSKSDNPGGWVEVTDTCDLSCPGCYRHPLAGHRSLAKIKDEIVAIKSLTNCDRIAIAGGEPLIYPDIVEVVDFISRQKLKPVLVTNGEKLTWELARALQKAGLAKFHIHVDCRMQRPGWIGKNEVEMNELRQHFADLVWELGSVQCGFNITIFRSSTQYLPDIVEWARQNIHKVQHISLVAFRAIPLTDELEYRVNDRKVDVGQLQHTTDNLEDISVTANEMYAVLEAYDPTYCASAYLHGSTAPETYKFLIAIQVGSPSNVYGYLGAKTLECVQVFHHLFKGRYCSFVRQPNVGRKLFLMAVFDREVRRTLIRFLKVASRNPLRLLDRVYVQSISLQQPNEILQGEVNLCDGCLNMMMYNNTLIPSCRLDEYRLYGGPITPVPRPNEERQDQICTAPPEGEYGG